MPYPDRGTLQRRYPAIRGRLLTMVTGRKAQKPNGMKYRSQCLPPHP